MHSSFLVGTAIKCEVWAEPGLGDRELPISSVSPGWEAAAVSSGHTNYLQPVHTSGAVHWDLWCQFRFHFHFNLEGGIKYLRKTCPLGYAWWAKGVFRSWFWKTNKFSVEKYSYVSLLAYFPLDFFLPRYFSIYVFIFFSFKQLKKTVLAKLILSPIGFYVPQQIFIRQAQHWETTCMPKIIPVFKYHACWTS